MNSQKEIIKFIKSAYLSPYKKPDFLELLHLLVNEFKVPEHTAIKLIRKAETEQQSGAQKINES